MRFVLAFISFTAIMMGGAMAISGTDYDKLSEVQRAEGNLSKWLSGTSAADILNASGDMAPKISTGNYESTKYDIPMGPYLTSFELRSSVDYFGVAYFVHNETVGSGKEYHTAQYEAYSLLVGYGDELQGRSTRAFWLVIAHYIGPAKYPAQEPTELFDAYTKTPRNWESGTIGDIIIDGKNGIEWSDIKWSKNYNIIGERYNYMYDIDPSTFVVINVHGDWDWSKDVSLLQDTIHIAEA